MDTYPEVPLTSLGHPVLTTLEPAAVKVSVCWGELRRSLLSQTYVTVHGPSTLIVAENWKLWGHLPSHLVGDTDIVMLVTLPGSVLPCITGPG